MPGTDAQTRPDGRGSVTLDQMLHIQSTIPGWLTRPAAAVAFLLLNELRSAPVMEIGVFRGRFLSVLRAAAGASVPVVGYDIYDEAGKNAVRRNLSRFFADLSETRLVSCDSALLRPERVIEDCGAPPICISIDGNHLADYVERDLWLAEQVLADDGIVAVDDFLNPNAIGVNEAFYRYQLSGRPGQRLAPFIYVGNKLFLARPARYDSMARSTHHILESLMERPMLDSFRNRRDAGQHTENELMGYSVVTVTL